MCHMAGTMKFSEVPPYPYTCRSLHRVRTGKMRDKALIRCSYSNDRFTVNLNSFGKAPNALHQAPLDPVTSRYLMARMSKLWTLATTPSSHPPATNSAARSFSSPAT